MEHKELLQRIFRIVDETAAIAIEHPEIVEDVDRLVGSLVRARLAATRTPATIPGAAGA